jgi:HD superfamily phosphohydrolase
MSNPGFSNGYEKGKPWGLPRSVLAPGKVFTDPVHRDIRLTKLEVALIDARPFQRLKRIRQLGNTHLVYPGAVHTRFSHSLGAMKVAEQLLDVVWNQSRELHGVEDDLFAEWRSHKDGSRRWEEVKVLARLGALLHDLCHVPAGHTVEDELGILEPHDENNDRFTALWEQIEEDVPERLSELVPDFSDQERQAVVDSLLAPSGSLHQELKPLVISKGKDTRSLKQMEYPFCADLVGNTICADLLDYLDRDHLFTGLPESLGRRFVSAFFVTPSERGSFSKRLVLNILRNGHERTDIVSELLKALRYRYELSERALVHPAKLAADAMLGESIERWEWALWWSKAKKRGLLDVEASTATYSLDRVARDREEMETAAGKREKSKAEWEKTRLGKIEVEVRAEMEKKFQQLGDEGLLDFLVGLPEHAPADLPRPLLRASKRLAEDLRDRNLFRAAEQIGAGGVSAQDVFEDYGSPADRAELEAEAQKFAGLGSEPRVILWIPPTDMRLKHAEVLVQQETGVAPFVTYERSRSRRGSDIYDAHERLWKAYVFVRRDVEPEKVKMVAAYLGWRMGIRWERHSYMGKHPDEWPLRLAVSQVFGANFDSKVDEVLAKHGAELAKTAARLPKTFKALEQRVKKVDGSSPD